MGIQGFLKQDTAANVTILMISSSDHISGKTGLSAGLTIYATKAAGTPTSISPTVTELSSSNAPGLYKLALTSGMMDTLGEFQLHVTGSGADPTDIVWQVCTSLPGEPTTSGSGSVSTTITITVLGNPQDGVDVWVTTDANGDDIVASGITDAFGEVTFLLDPGTYYAWKQLSGYDFTNPETLTVT